MNEVKDSVEFYRSLWAGAEARLADCESSLMKSQAEVESLKLALHDKHREADYERSVLVRDAVREVMNLRRDYDQACEDDHQLRAEVARLQSELHIRTCERDEASACVTASAQTIARLRAALERIGGASMSCFVSAHTLAKSLIREANEALEPTR